MTARKDGFKTHKPRVWIIPEHRGYEFKCCNCGVVHIVDFDTIFRVTDALFSDGEKITKEGRKMRCQSGSRKK